MNDKSKTARMDEKRKSEISLVTSLEGYILREGGLVIEFFGPPKSGKSWQITKLIELLKSDESFRELKPNFNYVVFKVSLKDERSKDDRFNFHMCYAQAHSYHLRRLRLNKKHPGVSLTPVDLVIADRGPIDDNHWPLVWTEEGKMSPFERDSALRVSYESEGLVNASILMYVSPEEALKREDEKTLEVVGHMRRGEVMNENTLATLCKLYKLGANGEEYKCVDPDGKRKSFRLSRRRPIFVDAENISSEDNAGYIKEEVFKLFVPTSDEYRRNGKQPVEA